MVELRKAQKQKAKLRIGLAGTSGSGKTYSSLQLAYGMTKDWNKICIIDTENGSADLYAHLGSYNVLTLTAPFTPERYAEYIHAAEAAGMGVIIIDSITHEWDGKGGCLEIVEALGGRYQDWAKVTPRHRSFIEAVLQSPCHILTTVRRKQDYEMTKDQNGKLRVEKMGLKEITREGFEYELTLSFNLSQNHLAQTSKDRTSLFMIDEKPVPEFVITKETGEKLKAWAESTVMPEKVATPPQMTKVEDKPTVRMINDFQRKKIFALGKELGKESEETKKFVKEYFNVEHFNEVTENQAANMIVGMMKKKKIAEPTMNENVDPASIPANL